MVAVHCDYLVQKVDLFAETIPLKLQVKHVIAIVNNVNK